MPWKTKLILIASGLVVIGALCGFGIYAIINHFSSPEDSGAIAAVPSSAGIETSTPSEVTNSSESVGGSDGSLPFRSVVQITAQYEEGGEILDGWTGSGSIITLDGLILTNAHVVLSDGETPVDALMVSITENPDEPPSPAYLAEVMQADISLDLAVIRIITDLDGNVIDPANLDLPAVTLGDSDSLSLGEKLYVLGYPGIGGETITFTSGEVSGFTSEESFGNRAFIKTNAVMAGGNSGGLAANEKGELIGIPTQLGYGGDQEVVDCRILADTNGDGVVDDNDTCIPTGGFINSLRPVNLALPFIEKAMNGEVAVLDESFIDDGGSQEASPDEGEVLFEDDFSDPDSGWEEISDEDGGAAYQNGKYEIDIIPANLVRWGVSRNSFDDVIISADVRIREATGEGDFGFLCRYADAENFYALEISEDGYAAIWKRVGGELVVLVDWQPIGEEPGSAFEIQASCIGDELTIALGENEVAAVIDGEFLSGDIGLIAGTNNVENLVVAFDNVEIRSP